MKDKFEHFDELFREKMFNYSPPPPEIVWKRIENSLGEPKKRSLFPIFLKLTAGIIFLAGLSAIYINIINNKNNNTNSPVISDQPNVVNSVKQLTQIKKTYDNKEIYVQKDTKIKGQNLLHGNSVNNQETSTSESNRNILSPVLNNTGKEIVFLYKSNVAEDSSNFISLIDVEIQTAKTPDNGSEVKSTKSDTVRIIVPPVKNSLDEILADAGPEKENSLKWMVGGQAGPQYSYRKLTTPDQSTANIPDYETYDAPLLAYAGGIQIQVEPSRRISIQSGVYYSRIGQSISTRNVNYERNDYFESTNGTKNNQPVEIVNSIGTIVYPEEITASDINLINTNNSIPLDAISASSSKGEFTGQQYFEYIEIPLMLRYRVIAQKIGVLLIGGLSTNILVNNSVEITNNDVTFETKTDALKTFNYSGTIGFGFDYPISKKILFNIEPFFKYYLAPINESSQAEAQPYMIGIMTGLNYSF